MREFAPEGAEGTMLPVADVSYASQIRELAGGEQAERIVFQAAVVAMLQTLTRVVRHEGDVAEAAISMAQGDMLRAMITELEAAVAALQEALNEQGTRMRDLSADAQLPRSKTTPTWWFSLTEAIQALELGIGRVSVVAAGQPRGGPVRALAGVIARLMHNHYNKLLAEAEHWMS